MSTLESAITGAIASAMANALVYPIDLAKTRIQSEVNNATQRGGQKQDSQKRSITERKKSRDVIRYILEILKRKGIQGLYQGAPTSIFSSFVQNFFYFLWYTFLRRKYFNLKTGNTTTIRKIRLSTLEELITGVCAATMTQLITNPIEVVLTRQQTMENEGNVTIMSVIKAVYEDNNRKMSSFWKGFKVSLILTINPSITFTSFQKLKELLFVMKGQTIELTAGYNFALGAMAKIISTLCTQPLIVAKVSLQRANSNFTHFQEVLEYIIKNEGISSLWKGLIPQIMKGILVQGFLFAFKGELIKLWKKTFLLRKLLLEEKSWRYLSTH
ncbi:Ant1p NDAI_0A04600 [Naumovozyma dairenensis CBS 421]|uniref:Uncharacterized protein n=1 Tax=Naumovozyma dairenensis (strain ATCC 10597 / BCRC 20456 / CBS 421 / NBRC 0211 / NRRL Y-12639) TaxID=1071378 RepID=G0W478_NAUDC|nr:hypothetical protein NDAI_0A04600 [Naumovozyma dairenensis CBS 421]CCD22616.1 hypothetical protein NDAI_0A04600 [Naumovozyma dairenensis CBS 421]